MVQPPKVMCLPQRKLRDPNGIRLSCPKQGARFGPGTLVESIQWHLSKSLAGFVKIWDPSKPPPLLGTNRNSIGSIVAFLICKPLQTISFLSPSILHNAQKMPRNATHQSTSVLPINDTQFYLVESCYLTSLSFLSRPPFPNRHS